MQLAKIPHEGLPVPSGINPASLALVRGDYFYYHFGCDDVDDRGWGCGYRTLQLLSSWVRAKQIACGENPRLVPSISEIQDALVKMQDKPVDFRGSKEWIGSVEVGLIIDYFFNVACPILHVRSGEMLQDHVEKITHHFRMNGSPVMVGGSTDTAAKALLGICESDKTIYFLILDPHYYGDTPNQDMLISQHLLEWRPLSCFVADSFYNLCMPRTSSRNLLRDANLLPLGDCKCTSDPAC